MHVRSLSVFLLLPFAACASSSGGERGLGALRQELGLMPPRGHVERDGRGAWVIDDELGVRLAAIEPDGAKCGGTSDTTAVWRLYEGSPHGAAVSFMGEEATLWWYDEAESCALAKRVFPNPAPSDGKALGSAELSFDAEDAADDGGEDADGTNDEVEVETDLYGAPIHTFAVAPDGQPSVKAHLSANQIEIIGASGDTLFSETGDVESSACRGSREATLSRAVRGDGSVLLGFTQSVVVVRGYDGSDAGCRGDTYEATSSLELWIAVDARAQTASVVYRGARSSGGEYGQSSDRVFFVVGLPVGALVFERSEEDSGFESRNTGSTVSWSWMFRPPNGEDITLASTPSY